MSVPVDYSVYKYVTDIFVIWGKFKSNNDHTVLKRRPSIAVFATIFIQFKSDMFALWNIWRVHYEIEVKFGILILN